MTLRFTAPPSGTWNPALGGTTMWQVSGNSGTVYWSSTSPSFIVPASGTTATIQHSGSPAAGNIIAWTDTQRPIVGTIVAGQMMAYGASGVLYAATSDKWVPVAKPGNIPSQSQMDSQDSGLYVKQYSGPDVYVLNPTRIPRPGESNPSTLYRVYSGQRRAPVFPAPVYAYPPGGEVTPTGDVYYCASGNWTLASGIDQIPTYSMMESAGAGVAWASNSGGDGVELIVANVACYVLNLDKIPYTSTQAYFTVNYAYGGSNS